MTKRKVKELEEKEEKEEEEEKEEKEETEAITTMVTVMLHHHKHRHLIYPSTSVYHTISLYLSFPLSLSLSPTTCSSSISASRFSSECYTT